MAPLFVLLFVLYRAIAQGEFNYDNQGCSWEVKSDSNLCAKGSEGRQSPIDLPSTSLAVDRPEAEIIRVVVGATKFKATVITNGMFKLDLLNKDEKANFFVVQGQQFHLVSILVHGPSEHTYAGKQAPVEIQMIHKHDSENKFAVLSIMVYDEKDVTEPAAQAVSIDIAFAEAFKEGNAEVRCDEEFYFDYSKLVPGMTDLTISRYFNYPGSFTVPPCSETVTWFNVVAAGKLNMDQFPYLRSMQNERSFRYLQPLKGRKITGCASSDMGCPTSSLKFKDGQKSTKDGKTIIMTSAGTMECTADASAPEESKEKTEPEKEGDAAKADAASKDENKDAPAPDAAKSDDAPNAADKVSKAADKVSDAADKVSKAADKVSNADAAKSEDKAKADAAKSTETDKSADKVSKDTDGVSKGADKVSDEIDVVNEIEKEVERLNKLEQGKKSGTEISIQVIKNEIGKIKNFIGKRKSEETLEAELEIADTQASGNNLVTTYFPAALLMTGSAFIAACWWSHEASKPPAYHPLVEEI